MQKNSKKPTKEEKGLDEIDREILWTYRKNPFLMLEEVSELVPRRIGAVKARVSNLKRIGYLRKGLLINPEREILPFRCLVHLGLYLHEFFQSGVKTMDGLIEHAVTASEKKTEFNRKIIVEDVYQTFGESDLIFVLLGESEGLVAKFIVDELASHRGVIKTITQPAFESIRVGQGTYGVIVHK